MMWILLKYKSVTLLLVISGALLLKLLALLWAISVVTQLVKPLLPA